METALEPAIDAATPLVELRCGDMVTPLFLFSGGDGNPSGLSALAGSIQIRSAVIGVNFCRPDAAGRLPSSVQMMAELSYSAIRSSQPSGPYFLVGYSFGGLVAVEVARLLDKAGEKVALLGLIDTLFDQRFWPAPIFLRSQLRVIRRHIRIIYGLPRDQMIRALFFRARGLFIRFMRKQLPVSIAVPPQTANSTNVTERHCKRVMSDYHPSNYLGPLTCFDAENHDEYGCHPGELWQRIVKDVECASIPGDHASIVTSQTSLAGLAAALDSKLEGCYLAMR
jgi:thioesterase domain-containing protein